MKRSSSEPGLRWRPRKFTCRLKRIPNLLRCFYLHSPCLTINITFKNLYEIFKRWIDFLVAKLKDRLFGGFRPPCATQRKHQHGVSIQSFIDLGKTNILRLNNRSDLILGEAFLIFISFHFPESGRYVGSITSRCSGKWARTHPHLFGEDQRPDPGDGGNRA